MKRTRCDIDSKYSITDTSGNGRIYIGLFTLARKDYGQNSSGNNGNNNNGSNSNSNNGSNGSNGNNGNPTSQYITMLESADALGSDARFAFAATPQNTSGTDTTYTVAYETLYLLKDHLRSIRTITDSQGNALERNDYYPYGLRIYLGKNYTALPEKYRMRMPAFSTSPNSNNGNGNSISEIYNALNSPTFKVLPYRLLYNGKELQTAAGTDYLDYGFRQYDQTIARWFNIDPKAEKYLTLTPYSYCAGNPISLIDIKGSFIGDPPGAGYYKARVNTRYVGFGVRNPVSSIRIGFGVTKGASDISTNATRFATRGEILYGSKNNQEDQGSENGAFRHVLWQASITSELGYSIAKQAGNAHEENPFASLEQILFDNLDEADQAVDLNNNEIGRIIGVNNSGNNMKELAFIVLEEFRKNGLYTAKKEQNGNWKVVKTILTQEKYEQLKYIFSTLNENGRTASEQQDADMKSKEKLNSLQLTWGTMK